jgi:glycosyltransferase involved in cell wall biosynthesis
MLPKKKIVWLCTYTNKDKRAKLSLWRNSRSEIGQWIPNLLKGFLGDELYEIHVASPEAWMRKTIESWEEDGITYHCFQPEIPLLGYSCRLPFEALTNYWFNRQHLKQIIKRVNPDIIHVFGTENPQYASVVLDVDPRIPVLVTIQGFIYRSQDFVSDYNTRVRCKYEKRLLTYCRHYTGEYDSEKVVRELNPSASWAHFYLPVNEALVHKTPPQNQCFDILFAGALTRAKGFHDFLTVISKLKVEMPLIRAGIVGKEGAFPKAIPYIKEHGLDGNVFWLGRFPDQSGLFKAYRQTKVFLTPTYNDAFASTIRECMLLGTPVVSYKTGGIPYANRDGAENVVIVEQGDLDAMAVQVLGLLRNEDRRLALANRARKFALTEFSLDSNVSVIRSEYKRLVEQSVTGNQ